LLDLNIRDILGLNYWKAKAQMNSPLHRSEKQGKKYGKSIKTKEEKKAKFKGKRIFEKSLKKSNLGK